MRTVDFKAQLRRQLQFLHASSAAFDAGFHDEAIRIATVIRVLIHQTKSSTSLLKHLNATTINLLSTCEGATDRTLMYIGMGTVQVSGDGTHKYFPSLGDVPVTTLVPVSKWWDQVVFVEGPSRLSRKKIVLSAANQDGGAHVDDKLNAEYQALTSDGFAGHVLHTVGGLYPRPSQSSARTSWHCARWHSNSSTRPLWSRQRPNPSVEARPNGKAPGPPPGVAYHPSAGPGALPLVPPHLER